MARFGTPDEAKENVIAPAIYTTSLSLGLYTNTQNSLGSDSVLADITEPDDGAVSNGYARQTLNGSWGFSGGTVIYTPNLTFTNTAASGSAWSSAVTGAFITDGTYLIHFLDRAAGAKIMSAGVSLEVDITTLVD